MSWYAAILLPQFPLQAVLRLREEMAGQPAAVVEGGQEKGWVLALTQAAAARGVFHGMASTQALARCPELCFWPRSPAQEEVVSAILLETAGTLSPWIEATGEGLCLVDLRQVPPCDWSAWAEGVVRRFVTWQLHARVGLASNPDLAALAARHASPLLVVQHPGAFLAGVTVAELDAPPELLTVLREWGIGHLGELARLSRGELVERLGPAAGVLWEHANGRAQRELRLVRVAETFFEAFDFERPIDTIEPLLFILRRQLDQLSLRLQEVYRVAAQMTLTLPLDGGAPFERVFTIPTPTRDADVLLRILHTYLESLRLEQQPLGVRLRITPVIANSQQFQLFESPLRDPNRFGETLGRLQALVGESLVGVVQLEDTYRPDQFRLVSPEFEKLSEAGEASAENETSQGVPLRRYRPAFPAQVQLHRQLPHYVSSAKIHGEVLEAAGPYRGSGNWWDRSAWLVEEWDIALDDGALYRISKRQDSWFVEGFYEAPVR